MSLRFPLGCTSYVKVRNLREKLTKVPINGASVEGFLYDSQGNLLDTLVFGYIDGSNGDYDTKFTALANANLPVDFQAILVIIANLGYSKLTKSFPVVIASDVPLPDSVTLAA